MKQCRQPSADQSSSAFSHSFKRVRRENPSPPSLSLLCHRNHTKASLTINHLRSNHCQTHTSMMFPPSLVPASVDACTLLFGKWQVRPVYIRGLKTHTSGFVCLLWQQPIMTLLSGTIGQMESQAPGEVRGQERKIFSTMLESLTYVYPFNT